MKLFIWDFHGTLEIGNDDAVIEITNRVLEERGHKRRLSMEEAETLAGKRWHEYFAFLFPEEEPSFCLNLQAACLAISHNHPEIIYKHIKPSPNALDVLEAIHKSPHTQIVLSNTQPKALDVFLHAVKIEEYFPAHHRIGADSHCQVRLTKKDWLNDFLKDRHFPAGLVAIGDSIGDVELAECHANGIGYLYANPGKKHRAPHYNNKIDDLKSILKEI